MPSLAFRKASICSRFSFSASCTLVVNPQHATRSRLILYWKLPPPSGSSCIGKDSHSTPTALGTRISSLQVLGFLSYDQGLKRHRAGNSNGPHRPKRTDLNGGCVW